MPTVAVLCATCRPGHHCECDVRSFCPSAWAGSARSPLGLRLQGCFWVCQAEGRAKATATRRRSAWTGQSAGRSLPLSSRLRGGPPRSPGLPADSAPARSAPPCGFGSQSPTEMWQVRTLSIQCEVWLRHGLFQITPGSCVLNHPRPQASCACTHAHTGAHAHTQRTHAPARTRTMHTRTQCTCIHAHAGTLTRTHGPHLRGDVRAAGAPAAHRSGDPRCPCAPAVVAAAGVRSGQTHRALGSGPKHSPRPFDL